jgi:predicted RNA binding protein YcfA (HicA-like mRNA interferase family)/predicted RNase H-like HicB family nuclease
VHRTFSVTVDRDSSTRWLVASVEQLPGCLTQAPDFPTLDANIHEAVDAWLDVFHEGRHRPEYRLDWQLDPRRLAGVLFASADPYTYTVDRPVSPNARIQTLVFVKLRRNTYWGLQRIAWNIGFHWVHSVGSHHVFRSHDGRLLVMPRSHTDWIGSPLLRRVLTILGVSAESYERLSRPVLYRAIGLPVPTVERPPATRASGSPDADSGNDEARQ